MQDDRMEQILLKLVGGGALAYALRPDGTLSVVDHKGQKHFFAREAYEHLLLGEKKDRGSVARRGSHGRS